VKDKEFANPSIRIEESKILGNRRLSFKFSYSEEIKKYFLSNCFWVEYDEDINDVSPSILEIPAVSNILPIAWATGSNIYVKELDKGYLESVNKIKAVMKRWYPELSFSANIDVEKIVSNSFGNKGHGLLFGGGIDSTASYIRNKSKKPNLIIVWGADIPLDREEFWRKVKKKYRDFANHENVNIAFIKTNMRQFLNEKLLTLRFGRYLSDHSWWGGLHHGIGLLGLCAPVSVTRHLGTILIAASHTQRLIEYPWGSHPLVDNKISWADVKVIHDSYDLTRQEKIHHIIKPYIESSDSSPLLRVCWSQFQDFNCNECEKCSRTIAGLLVEGIDPNKCGFKIDSKVLGNIKQNLVEKKFILSPGKVFLWKNIQEHIPEKMANHSLYGCKEFFEWIKDYDFSENLRREHFLLRVYHKIPENILKVIKNILERLSLCKLYSKINILNT
jgi:hypothetical protein